MLGLLQGDWDKGNAVEENTAKGYGVKDLLKQDQRTTTLHLLAV